MYSYQPREGSVHSHATTVSRVLSTEHNKSAVFHQNHLHYNLSAVIHQKGPSLSKKIYFFLSFLGNSREFYEITPMVTKIIHVNFFIIVVFVFFFHWIINIFLNDFLIEKLNFFFFYKNTRIFRALRERIRVSSHSSTTRVFMAYALFQANPIISTNSVDFATTF